MREDYIFADREVMGSYGLRAKSEREPPFGAADRPMRRRPGREPKWGSVQLS